MRTHDERAMDHCPDFTEAPWTSLIANVDLDMAEMMWEYAWWQLAADWASELDLITPDDIEDGKWNNALLAGHAAARVAAALVALNKVEVNPGFFDTVAWGARAQAVLDNEPSMSLGRQKRAGRLH